MNSIKVKTEDMEEMSTSKLQKVDHLHSFTVRFGSRPQKYTIDCTEPRTVLQAIKEQYHTELQEEMDKSQKRFNDNIKKRKIKTNETVVFEENIIIKVGEGNDSPFIATHFPCCLVKENECLTIMIIETAVEKRQEPRVESGEILPKDNYSVFFIDEKLPKGDNYKGDMVFICNKIPANFKYFCVYGIKRREGSSETLKDALRRDGRFVDGLTDFSLSHNETANHIKHTGVVDKLDGKKFKICKLPPKTQPKAENPEQQKVVKQNPTHEEQEAKVSAPTREQSKRETISVVELAAKKGVSIKTAMEKLGYKNINHEEINDILRKQYPKLKELMESRFSDSSFEETLKPKKENFAKIQDSFSEVHTVRELLKLSEFICLLKIKENNSNLTVKGTGFVLFDNFVLTNAHLFEPWEKKKDLGNYVNITAEFNFENENIPKTEYQATLVGGSHDLDFALLELNQNPDQTELQIIPQGLLKKFGPVPEPVYDSGACIIGHPAAEVKKMDITCIIRKEKRDQAVEQNLVFYEPFIVCSTKYQIKRDPYADIRVTYNSFMYHGSSGSPVFDAFGHVFGLHSGGFFYNEIIPGHSVLEFCYPLLDIFKKLLDELQKAGRMDLLERIQVEAKGNPYLEEILESVGLTRFTM